MGKIDLAIDSWRASFGQQVWKILEQLYSERTADHNRNHVYILKCRKQNPIVEKDKHL